VKDGPTFAKLKEPKEKILQNRTMFTVIENDKELQKNKKDEVKTIKLE
jgi:hypothetical protein